MYVLKICNDDNTEVVYCNSKYPNHPTGFEFNQLLEDIDDYGNPTGMFKQGWKKCTIEPMTKNLNLSGKEMNVIKYNLCIDEVNSCRAFKLLNKEFTKCSEITDYYYLVMIHNTRNDKYLIDYYNNPLQILYKIFNHKMYTKTTDSGDNSKGVVGLADDLKLYDKLDFEVLIGSRKTSKQEVLDEILELYKSLGYKGSTKDNIDKLYKPSTYRRAFNIGMYKYNRYDKNN